MIKQKLTTRNKSSGTNTGEYIVLHHTATKEGSIRGVLNTLTVGKVSCHFVVDTNGDIYQIGELKDILWHAGISSWRGRKDMNRYSIGIEIIGPLPGFTNAQRKSVRELCSFLVGSLGIPVENIIRHKDIAPGRKTDIADTFWNNDFKTYSDWVTSLFTIPTSFMDKFEQALKDEQTKTPGVALITKFEGESPLSEKATRELLEIGLLRLYRLLKK